MKVTVSLQRHCVSSRNFFRYYASPCSHRILWLVCSPISFHGSSGQPGVIVTMWELWLVDKSCQMSSDCQLLLLPHQGGLWPPSGWVLYIKINLELKQHLWWLETNKKNPKTYSPVSTGCVFVLPFHLLFPPCLEEAGVAASLGSVILSIQHTVSSLNMGLWLFRDNSAAHFCVLTYFWRKP